MSMQVLGSASRTRRGCTRMDILDLEGMTFCLPQLSEMSFRLPFTDGECRRVELPEGSWGRVDSTGSFAAIVSRTLWWRKRTVKFWRIVSLLRHSEIINFGISSDTVLYLVFYNLKIIDDRFHTKTYCKIVACYDTADWPAILYMLQHEVMNLEDERYRQVFRPFSLYIANRCPTKMLFFSRLTVRGKSNAMFG